MTTKGFQEDFATIELLLASDASTKRTDAFILAYSKMEKQVRRIFTYIVFQEPAFYMSESVSKNNIAGKISSKGNLYFQNFISGFNAIYPESFESIVGSDYYTSFLKNNFCTIDKFRNKIVHGQLTGEDLDKDALERVICILQDWCSRVGEKMMKEIGYDGLEKNSLRKHSDKNLADTYLTHISDIKGLDTFIKEKMSKEKMKKDGTYIDCKKAPL